MITAKLPKITNFLPKLTFKLHLLKGKKIGDCPAVGASRTMGPNGSVYIFTNSGGVFVVYKCR